VFFNNQNCSTAAYASLPADGTFVIESSTTGGLLTCVNTTPGAIGYAAVQTADAANSKTISIDGVFPNSTGAVGATPSNNAASGKYPFYFEVYFNGRSGFLTSSTATNARFSQYIVSRLQNVAQLPNNSSSLLALPTSANFTGSTATRMTAEGTRFGNACNLLQGQQH
jgi:hypothetical protein